MTEMGKKKVKKPGDIREGDRYKFTPEERAEAVRIVFASNGRRTIVEIAADLGLNDKTLNRWVVDARNAAVDPEGSMPDATRRRIRELESKVAQLEKDLEFAKKARALPQRVSLRRSKSQ